MIVIEGEIFPDVIEAKFKPAHRLMILVDGEDICEKYFIEQFDTRTGEAIIIKRLSNRQLYLNKFKELVYEPMTFPNFELKLKP